MSLQTRKTTRSNAKSNAQSTLATKADALPKPKAPRKGKKNVVNPAPAAPNEHTALPPLPPSSPPLPDVPASVTDPAVPALDSGVTTALVPIAPLIPATTGLPSVSAIRTPTRSVRILDQANDDELDDDEGDDIGDDDDDEDDDDEDDDHEMDGFIVTDADLSHGQFWTPTTRGPINLPPIITVSSPILASSPSAQSRGRRISYGQTSSSQPSLQIVDVLEDHRNRKKRKVPKYATFDTAPGLIRKRTSGPQVPTAPGVRNEPERWSSPEAPVELISRKRKRGGMPKAHQLGYYTPNTRLVLQDGRQRFKAKVLLVNPFLTEEQRAQFGAEAWHWALMKNASAYQHSSQIVFSRHIQRMFGDVAWVVRSNMKGTARDLVPDFYSLIATRSLGDQKSTSAFIKSRVENLLKDGCFLRGPFQGRDDIPFSSTAISTVIFYSVYRTLSTEERSAFHPMPLATIALAATALKAALDEWKTGSFVPINFTEERFAPTYRHYEKKLIAYRAARRVRYTNLAVAHTAFCWAQLGTPVEEEVEPVDLNMMLFDPDSEDDEPEEGANYDHL